MRYKAKEMINASLRIPEKGIFAEKKNTCWYKNSIRRNGDFARNRIHEYSPHDCQFMVMEGSQLCQGRSGSRVPRGAGECC